jgi:hypothetical protein
MESIEKEDFFRIKDIYKYDLLLSGITNLYYEVF